MSEPLEIACLEEFWASHTGNGPPLDEMVGKLLLDTLGLGNQQVFEQLYLVKPDYAGFVQWIIETAGQPDPRLVDRYHAWLYDMPPGEEAKAQLDAVAAMPDVLDAAALAYWDEHGYVVLPDAISADEIDAVKALLWQTIGASPDDPESWYRARTNGIMVPHFQGPALEAARRSPRVHKAFAQLWGSENLWVLIDRMGFNPPERLGHSFSGSDIHWDASLVQPIPFHTQAVLYLSDTAEDQGAFRCVPGFHKRIDDWLASLDGANPREADLSAGVKHVAGRAGDLIIWRQDLPHAASPNRSDKPRLAQYLTYYSPDMVIRPWR
ncbi:phytanoyl-CoA dioxygenase [Sphingopyxis sp. QXT-31]|uniref:phytanoyl-CoA dioxygenase family protein n=1 Tax=Sphingopyxis sp. QXT-31 TaxID=1357916 RepID=UPI0009792B8E|nr:phytanoyl-CoA dioxygenase family protein [Sphingopyxis sp. QXT-31]APZ99138.1 phytanoyl-CoA dioxygenase [Sphingopyxis sp. QXT-31]